MEKLGKKMMAKKIRKIERDHSQWAQQERENKERFMEKRNHAEKRVR